MAWGMQMSEHAKRAFLLGWSERAPLEDWLEPSTFDWRVNMSSALKMLTGANELVLIYLLQVWLHPVGVALLVNAVRTAHVDRSSDVRELVFIITMQQ